MEEDDLGSRKDEDDGDEEEWEGNWEDDWDEEEWEEW
jgi:hypothetical protein